ncbi:MAG: hypothetical protein J0626_09880 [Rhodospirillaceae bacterium]|nr:hypothetical protein [Rhodospirillaceae bacterium]
MSITQIGSVAAGVEAARFAGVQQSGQAADLKKTEVVEESSERSSVSSTSDRRLDITV